MLKKAYRIFIRLVAGMSLLLVVSCAFLIHKERATLARLVNPGANPVTTDVYSRWQELRPDESLTWDRLEGWLRILSYRPVSVTPAEPGDYRARGQEMTIFVRPFRYPDKDYPAQLLVLRFSGQRLRKIIAVAGKVPLDEWRLDPLRLAHWGQGDGASRPQVRVSELPPYVPGAILAMEDKRFFHHGAFDLLGIARATWVDLSSGALRQGASTISQQLARSIFLDVRRTWRRKALEAALAVYLELRYAKPQLLEMYLNQVYWGQEGSENLLGLEMVSRSLFGKPARDLSVAEGATLAGMLQAPNRYSPRLDAKAAFARRKMVLGLMRAQKTISPVQYRSALDEQIRLAPIKGSNGDAYFLAALHDQLAGRYSLAALFTQGWTIYTTLDPLLQEEAVRVLSSPASVPGRSRPRGVGPQAALVALDPASGAIRAWVGGTNFQTNPFDHAANARRQPGSAFKPFVVLAALESRKLTSGTLLEDKPLVLKGNQGTWTPQNYDHTFRGRVSVWDSLVYSYNVPTVRLAMLAGILPIIDVARRAGIESPLRTDLSLALGTSEVSPLELTGAYATLASGGDYHRPYPTEVILGQDGKVLESHAASPVKAFTPELTFLVTQMLEDVLERGTAQGARKAGFTAPAAGKTGTSENYQDAWFIGYTTDLVCGVWVGYDQPKSLGRSAAGIALPIWTAFMKKAVALDSPRAFEVPEEIIWKTIDVDSGLLARSGCVHRRKAGFLPGTAPTADCPLHAGGLTGFFHRWRAKT